MLTAVNCEGEHHLVVSNTAVVTKSLLSRLEAITSAKAKAVLIDSRLTGPEVDQLGDQLGDLIEVVSKPFELSDLERYGRIAVDCVVDRVFVDSEADDFKAAISAAAQRLRIPVNVANSSELSTFTLPSTFTKGDLQIGVTTNHQGCKLANRIRREVVQNLPENIDEIVANVGELRRRVQALDGESTDSKRRAAWLSQIIEYYPLNQMDGVSVEDLSESFHHFDERESTPELGEISLVGSGPGALSMLTIGALNAIYNADIVLADKLVPQQIIDTIPKSTELFIARKFPGNAARAQEELLELGLESLKAGKKVVRLKQGDPYIFGRGGEEYKYFTEQGYEPVVVPGLSSALVAPVVANIPTTQRGVSDQVVVCTGTGRNGKVPENLPDFDAKRTVMFLMSIKKIVDLLPVLQAKSWPTSLPVCVVERASCADQRIIRTRLGDLPSVLEKVEGRPPGLIVAGYSCEYLVPPVDGEYRIEEGIRDCSVDKIVEALAKVH